MFYFIFDIDTSPEPASQIQQTTNVKNEEVEHSTDSTSVQVRKQSGASTDSDEEWREQAV